MVPNWGGWWLVEKSIMEFMKNLRIYGFLLLSVQIAWLSSTDVWGKNNLQVCATVISNHTAIQSGRLTSIFQNIFLMDSIKNLKSLQSLYSL